MKENTLTFVSLEELMQVEKPLLATMNLMRDSMTMEDAERFNSIVKPSDLERMRLDHFSPGVRHYYQMFQKLFYKLYRKTQKFPTEVLREISDHNEYFVSIEGWRHDVNTKSYAMRAGINFRFTDKTACEVKFML